MSKRPAQSLNTNVGPSREIALFAALAAMILLIFITQGDVYTVRMLVEAGCYAVLALGLTIQWGYAGMFNVGIMGLIAAAAATNMLLTFPINAAFWSSPGAPMLGWALLTLLMGVALIVAIHKSANLGIGNRLRGLMLTIACVVVYYLVTSQINAAATVIETDAGWVGGLGLPVLLGWAGAGVVAGAIAFLIGKICLGLRADYLAIATLGIAQIIKTFLKNADWLTRGTLTVSPLPWPTPTAGDVGFLWARSFYLCLVVVLITAIYLLLQRAYHAPWGRMVRSIRDNEDAAEAMGKDVNRRRLEIFVFGSVIMGIGGAMLITFVGLFDPSGYVDLNHTFLIWVMVVLGGSGNNRGAIFGAIFVYILWVMSEPLATTLFKTISIYGEQWFGWIPPADLDSRALQMRVFVIGLTITLVVRFLPDGFLPERTLRRDTQ